MDAENTAIAPAEIDWNTVQERYLAGEELAAIAEDCGTTPRNISQRAWRYGWKAQQFKRLERDRKEVELEVRGCITVSVLKEARAFQREDTPLDYGQRDLAGRCRIRLLETAARLFGWDADPLKGAKVAKAIDI